MAISDFFGPAPESTFSLNAALQFLQDAKKLQLQEAKLNLERRRLQNDMMVQQQQLGLQARDIESLEFAREQRSRADVLSARASLDREQRMREELAVETLPGGPKSPERFSADLARIQSQAQRNLAEELKAQRDIGFREKELELRESEARRKAELEIDRFNEERKSAANLRLTRLLSKTRETVTGDAVLGLMEFIQRGRLGPQSQEGLNEKSRGLLRTIDPDKDPDLFDEILSEINLLRELSGQAPFTREQARSIAKGLGVSGEPPKETPGTAGTPVGGSPAGGETEEETLERAKRRARERQKKGQQLPSPGGGNL